ncbi:MAG: thymidine kinase [Aeromonas veronii]
MAQLYFHHASMNSGKSAHLLQVAHNYKERGMLTCLITAGLDDRYGVGKIASRIGLAAPALTFSPDTDMFELIQMQCKIIPFDCILVDEAQFLTRKQVMDLSRIVDTHNVPVMCYGLRTDFKAELFEGSNALFCLADKFVEMKGICHCGRKATMVAKLDKDGIMVSFDSPQIEIGGNDRYVSMCRKHYFEEYDRMVSCKE